MSDSFDLDQALTLEDLITNTVTVTVNTKQSSPEELARDKVSGMATVGPSLGVCTVCMESLYVSSCKQAPCGHLYHADCITQWLSVRNSCPICRFKVPDHPEKAPASPPVKKID